MRAYSHLLKAAVLLCTFTLTASASGKPEFVYVGNTGDDTVSVFVVNDNGRLTPLEPRVASPICGMPTFLVAADHILLVGGEYTAVCSGPGLGGGTVYLYPIQSSGKLGAVSVSYLNDVESIALGHTGKLAFASGASLNPHAEADSISGWNVGKKNLETSLPSSPTNFFNFQTGDGLLPFGIAVGPNDKFLYALFSKYSNYNSLGDAQVGVLSLLLDGGIGTFVAEPVEGCRGPEISGGVSGTLLTLTLKSKTVLYYQCLKGAGVNVPGTPVIGSLVVDSSTGKILKTYSAFIPPSGVALMPVAVDSSGRWLAASNGAGKIDMLAINQDSGELSEPAHHMFNLGANSVAFDHTGKFLYAARTGTNSIAAFHFDSVGGKVKLGALGLQATGPAPTVVVVAQPK